MSDYGEKRYRRNPRCFTRNGDPIRGLTSDSIKIPIKREDPAATDRENRKQVIDTIESAVLNGITLEEITSQLANNDEIKQKFRYLSNSNLEEIFKGWYKGRIRPRKEIEKIIR